MDDSGDLAALVAGLVGSPFQLEMVVRAGQSLELTDGLWELVPVVVDAGRRHSEATPQDVADATASGRRLDTAVRAKIREYADGWVASTETRLDSAFAESPALDEVELAAALRNVFGFVGSVVDVPALAAEVMPGLLASPFNSMDEQMYLQAYVRAVRRPSRTPQLLRALVVTAISSIEPFATRLALMALYHGNPGRYTSLADANLDDDARKLFKGGGPKKWCDQLGSLGIAALPLVVDWDRLDELWQDRNVIVHRGSVVDAKHSAGSGAMVGTVLSFDPDEVRSVIDEIGAARFGIACAVWDYVSPTVGGQQLAAGVAPILFESLAHGRWPQAEGLSRVQEAFATDPEEHAAARINRWIAIDHRSGTDAIRDEVLAFDVSALPATFALARSVLLQQTDEALDQLRVLVDREVVSVDDLDTWPLFWRLRDDERFDELVRIATTKRSE